MLYRVLRTSKATIKHTFYLDEVPTDSSTAVTVDVVRMNGTDTLVTGGATTQTGTVGEVSYVVPGGPAFPASVTWQLDELTIAWNATIGGVVVKEYDTVQVVGGFIYLIPELRNRHKRALGNTTDHPTTDLVQDRLGVEDECERICRQAWVPRFARETLSGRGTPYLGTGGKTPNTMLTKLRYCSIGGVVMSQADMNAIGLTQDGAFVRPGGAVWPVGVGNVIVEYEYGNSRPVEPVKTAAMLRARSIASRPNSAIPDRATSYTNQEGAVYTLTTGDEDHTGIPDVDAAYLKYQRRRRATVG